MVKDTPPPKPAAYQPAGQSACDRPPFLASPRSHDPAFYVLWLKEIAVLLDIVVPERGDARGSHTDNAVHDRLFRPRRLKKGHITDAHGMVVIRHNFHHFRLSQSRIHAGTHIGSDEHGPGDIPVMVLQWHGRS